MADKEREQPFAERQYYATQEAQDDRVVSDDHDWHMEVTFPGTEIVRELAGIPPNTHPDWHENQVGLGYCRVPGCDHDPQNMACSRNEEGRVLLGGPEGVRRRHPDVQTVYAQHLRLVPYRGCCHTLEDTTHLRECPSQYFVRGQVVVTGAVDFMLGSARMVMREDTVSSDRTFENETRLNPRPARNLGDWLF